MEPNKYFDSVIKDRGKERDIDISNELAKREVDTIFFLLKNFYGINFSGTNNLIIFLIFNSILLPPCNLKVFFMFYKRNYKSFKTFKLITINFMLSAKNSKQFRFKIF